MKGERILRKWSEKVNGEVHKDSGVRMEKENRCETRERK